MGIERSGTFASTVSAFMPINGSEPAIVALVAINSRRDLLVSFTSSFSGCLFFSASNGFVRLYFMPPFVHAERQLKHPTQREASTSLFLLSMHWALHPFSHSPQLLQRVLSTFILKIEYLETKLSKAPAGQRVLQKIRPLKNTATAMVSSTNIENAKDAHTI